MKLTRLGLLLLPAVALAACSEANGPNDALDQAIDQDVAVVAADAAIGDVQQMVLPVGAPAVVSADAAGPPATFSRTVTFFDADGVEQSAYNPLTTASINVVVDLSHAVEREGWSASVERHRDLTVSGLEGQETSRIWNGTSSGTVMRSRHTEANGTRTYDMTTSSVITDVVVGVPRSENPWPLSGTITRTIMITITNGPNGDVTRERTVTIEFNGTQFATLTVNGETFEVDLAARDRQRPVRHR